MSQALRKIVIVGGGSAGWLTAGIIAAEHVVDSAKGLELVLVESPDVPTIGVGEGTWPSMKNTLKKIGISETQFIRECDVSFKQGSKFVNWVSKADSADVYYHPFSLPEGFQEINLAEHWLAEKNDVAFADAVSAQFTIAERMQAPKVISTPEYGGVLNYGYHLNAGKFTELLKSHCVNTLGVRHIVDHVLDVKLGDSGDIESLLSQSNGEIGGDLFIDCSGFSSLLLGKHLGVPFVEKKKYLFNDSALVVQPPYAHEESEIASCTVATANDSGWIWDIGLPTRKGVGHVYSSAHTSDAQVEANLREYLLASLPDNIVGQLSFRKLTFNPGHREVFWKGNCVAVGIAAGFIEPLEATALVLIELSASMISEQLPANRESMEIICTRFNKKFTANWERIVEFLKLHYVLSSRDESDYWRDHRQPDSIPDSLQELLTVWKHKAPWDTDIALNEMFPWASYQFILYGMGFKTELIARAKHGEPRRKELANKHFAEVRKKADMYTQNLPGNRQLLGKVKEFGFQKM